MKIMATGYPLSAIFTGVRLSLRHDPDNENLLSTGQETLRYAQV
jgi:hypothetical protein